MYVIDEDDDDVDESGKRKFDDCISRIFLVFVTLSFYLKYQEMNISVYW